MVVTSLLVDEGGMVFQELSIKGLLLIKPQVFEDGRGFFLERFSRKAFEENQIDVDFVQDNHSHSVKHVLRGLHFQKPPFAQGKLVWVTRGEVFDVAIDLRKGSPTFGKWEAVILSEENKQLFWIPKGFAHGFTVLSERADLLYKVSDYYSSEHECGVIWNDPDIGIDWPVDNPILSNKDRRLPRLRELEHVSW